MSLTAAELRAERRAYLERIAERDEARERATRAMNERLGIKPSRPKFNGNLAIGRTSRRRDDLPDDEYVPAREWTDWRCGR